MKKYKVLLIKSYEIEVEANNKEEAAHFTELYTSDIQPILPKDSTIPFVINEIACTTNEVIEVN